MTIKADIPKEATRNKGPAASITFPLVFRDELAGGVAGFIGFSAGCWGGGGGGVLILDRMFGSCPEIRGFIGVGLVGSSVSLTDPGLTKSSSRSGRGGGETSLLGSGLSAGPLLEGIGTGEP